MCKATGKLFTVRMGLKSTKEYLVSMWVNIGIPVLDLVNKNTGGEHLGTWVNPKVAVNLAQWLSPVFAVQVSNWIYDLMTKGKVEVNIKLLKEKEKTIKNCKKRIEYLEKQTLKRIPRKNLDNKFNAVYLITCDELEPNRKYIIGKAKDLLNRLSQYDKMSNYRVVYSKSFKDEIYMEFVESIVLHSLEKYKEQMNQDRFIRPVDKDLNIFKVAFVNASKRFEN